MWSCRNCQDDSSVSTAASPEAVGDDRTYPSESVLMHMLCPVLVLVLVLVFVIFNPKLNTGSSSHCRNVAKN